MDHGSPRPRAASSLRSSDATPSKCSSMDTRPRPSPSGSDSPARHQLQTAVRLHLRCRRVSRAIRIFAVETPRSPSSTASAWRWSTLGCGVLDGDAGNDPGKSWDEIPHLVTINRSFFPASSRAGSPRKQQTKIARMHRSLLREGRHECRRALDPTRQLLVVFDAFRLDHDPALHGPARDVEHLDVGFEE
jgi:hypothetical protein